MKLSVSSYSLSGWRSADGATLEDTIDYIADCGAAGIEFSGLDDKAKKNPIARATALRKRAEKRGLKVVNYCVWGEFIAPPAKQREMITRLKLDVDIAAALGAPSMRHDVTRGFGENAKGVKGPKTFENALKIVVPPVREIADYGASVGVKTSLENHGWYMQASERVEKLIRAVNHPNYGLTIDLGNFLCVNEEPTKAVARLAKYAIMAHAKDFHIKPKDRKPAFGWFDTASDIVLRGAIAGHGQVDIPKELKLLKKAGYNGFLSLEFEGIEDPRQGVKLGLEYLREQLKAI